MEKGVDEKYDEWYDKYFHITIADFYEKKVSVYWRTNNERMR